MKPEEFSGDNQYYCGVCDKHVEFATKTTALLKTPPFLIVVINRFFFDRATQARAKIMDRVDIDEEIEFGGEAYDLESVGVHAGRNLGSGHYYALCRTEELKWRVFNDSFVTDQAPDFL